MGGNLDNVTFSRQYRETVAWCQPRVQLSDIRGCLRSKELAPPSSERTDLDPTFWNSVDAIAWVVEQRSKLVGVVDVGPPPSTATGKLLACRFEQTNHNYGAAEYSHGFFDGNDNPPWDCWVGFVDSILIAWVPSELVATAKEGMAVECVGALSWVSESKDLPTWLRQCEVDLTRFRRQVHYAASCVDTSLSSNSIGLI
jgi:hypothetical protein